MIDLYVKIGLVLVGAVVLLFSLVDVRSLLTKLLFSGTAKKQPVVNKEEGFLEIIGLWYQLKNKCDEFHLNVASEELDKVFPLLNKVLEDEKVAQS
jgi:hypothetical protein